MDPRVDAIVAEELGAGLPGLAGSEARVTIRLTDQLLNQIVAASLPPDGALRGLALHAIPGNTLEVTITLARPAFLPPLHAHVTIERQPALPDNAVLALRIGGGASGLLKIAGPFLGSLRLPEGIRLDGDLLLVDLRAVLAAHGQSAYLTYLRELSVATADAVVVVHAVAGVA